MLLNFIIAYLLAGVLMELVVAYGLKILKKQHTVSLAILAIVAWPLVIVVVYLARRARRT